MPSKSSKKQQSGSSQVVSDSRDPYHFRSDLSFNFRSESISDFNSSRAHDFGYSPFEQASGCQQTPLSTPTTLVFQPPSFYPQTPYIHQIDPYYIQQSPLQNHEYNQQYYPYSNPYQQQHFLQSPPLPNSRCNSSSHKAAGSVGALIGNIQLDPWQLQQLSEIRILVQHMITQVEDLQSILSKYSNSVIPAMSSEEVTTALTSVTEEKPASDPAPSSAIDDALPARGAEAKKPTKAKNMKFLLLQLKKLAADSKAKQPATKTKATKTGTKPKVETADLPRPLVTH